MNPPNNLSLDNSGYGYSPSQGSLPSQRLDNLLGGPNNNDPPQPPERGSSYVIMSQVETSKATPPRPPVQTSMSNGVVNTPNSNTTTPKRVSFQDPTTPPSPPSPTLEKIMEDPDVKIFFLLISINTH